jgi:hypothetical protein
MRFTNAFQIFTTKQEIPPGPDMPGNRQKLPSRRCASASRNGAASGFVKRL